MPRIVLTREIVTAARQRAWQGQPIKAIARDLGQPYAGIWQAVRGDSWRWLRTPPPVPVGAETPPIMRACGNPLCGAEYPVGQGAADRCAACYSYRYRHGVERNPTEMTQGPARYLRGQRARRVIALYRGGMSLAQVAEAMACSQESVRRTLERAGIARRPRYQSRLTAAAVRHARNLIHREGWSIARAARHFDTSYMAMYDIARGYTWRDAGGPTSPARGHVVESRPCRHCGLQTDHESGQCVFCRQERRAEAIS